MVRCADGSLYAGVALDARRRAAEHNGDGRGGAKYTRARRPVKLVYLESARDRSSAMKREAALKRLPKVKKEALARRKAGRGLLRK
jgi:putative endonuclease